MGRDYGTGSITRNPADPSKPLKTWQASIAAPKPDNPNYRIWKRSKDKKVLVAWLDEKNKEKAATGSIYNETMTVDAWFTYWFDKVAINEIRPKTLANYRSMYKTHIADVIGRVKLEKITPAHIRKVTETVVAPREVRGKTVTRSSSTAQSVHRILSSSLADAEREGRIPRNPAKLVKPPKKAATDLEVLTTDEARRLLTHYAGTPEGYLWVTILLAVARRGEILGLEWDRVTDELDLSWQLQRYKIGEFRAAPDYEYRQLTPALYLTRPKSAAGKRVVPLVDPLRGILETWRAIAPTNPYGLVFATQAGEPIDPDWASKVWPAALAEVGINKHVRLHDLRHSGVDLLYEAGVPEAIIMELVGHSTRAMTRSYKSRGNRPQLVDAMTKVGELVTGTPQQSHPQD